MTAGNQILRTLVGVVLSTLSLPLFADVIVGTPQQVEELVALNALSQKFTSRIEIPYEELRKRFQELAESGTDFEQIDWHRLGPS